MIKTRMGLRLALVFIFISPSFGRLNFPGRSQRLSTAVFMDSECPKKDGRRGSAAGKRWQAAPLWPGRLGR